MQMTCAMNPKVRPQTVAIDIQAIEGSIFALACGSVTVIILLPNSIVLADYMHEWFHRRHIGAESPAPARIQMETQGIRDRPMDA